MGGNDAFVVRLDETLTVLNAATYLGGTGFDTIGDGALSGCCWHPGASPSIPPRVTSTLPGRPNRQAFRAQRAAQPTHASGAGSGRDAYVARLKADFSTMLDQATYLGGDVTDAASVVVIHPSSGEIYVGGLTSSTNFPGDGRWRPADKARHV